MRKFAETKPIIFEIILFIIAMAVALLLSLAGQMVSIYNELAVAIGRIIVGILLVLIFRHCFMGSRPFSGLKYALPALLFVLWNVIYNPISGMRFTVPTAETIILGLAPAIFEEVIFRGIFIYNLREKGRSPMAMLIISAVLFGIVHLTNVAGMSFANALVQTIYAIVIGLVLGAVYIKSGDIVSVIVIHALIDISSHLFVGDTETSVPVIIVFALLLIVEAIYAIWIILKEQRSGGGMTETDTV